MNEKQKLKLEIEVTQKVGRIDWKIIDNPNLAVYQGKAPTFRHAVFEINRQVLELALERDGLIE